MSPPPTVSPREVRAVSRQLAADGVCPGVLVDPAARTLVDVQLPVELLEGEVYMIDSPEHDRELLRATEAERSLGRAVGLTHFDAHTAGSACINATALDAAGSGLPAVQLYGTRVEGSVLLYKTVGGGRVYNLMPLRAADVQQHVAWA